MKAAMEGAGAVHDGRERQGRTLKSFTVLVASNDGGFTKELSGYLEPFGYAVISTADSLTALEMVRTERPDLVISEIDLPPLTGFELCHAIKNDASLKVTPLLLVSDSVFDIDAKVKGLAVGADDLLHRPIHEMELRARIRSSLRRNAYVRQLLKDRGRLEELVVERTKETEHFTLSLVAALERANRMNDSDTGAHLRRVSAYSEALASALNLEPSLVSRIHRYASLHDVGKVGLPDSILKKEGKLTPEEFEAMKAHTTMGFEILTEAQADKVACLIALHHHERFDGSGYPHAMVGFKIPIEARIVALADVYDALTTRRCYKTAMPPDEAHRIVLEESGRHFDPSVVRAFEESRGLFLSILDQHGD